MWFTIRILLLSLWVGAMAGFAFVFAPIFFHHVGPTPEFAASVAACVRAVVRIGDWIAVIAAAITVFARMESRPWGIAIVACLAVATLCGFIELNMIVPQMERTALETPAYDALHRQSSGVYGAAFLAALAALVLSSRR
jgi:Domain of unknown function (DUF4149)